MSRVDRVASPTGRLDAYIRSFEERYGAVPIEGLNDSLEASISSISLEASVATKEPNGGSRPTLAPPPRSMFGFTPRFQWEEPFLPTSFAPVEPVEPVAHVSRLASPTRHCGPDLSRISVPRHKWPLASALNSDASVTGTTAATGYVLSQSDTFDLRLRSRSPTGSVNWGAPLAHSQVRSHQAFGEPKSPSKKPERARASSNPPELKMKGPEANPGKRSSFETIRPLIRSDTYLAPPPMSFIHPLPAPRGPRPWVPLGQPPVGPGAHRAVDAIDEVNCQSPVRIPQPTKLLNLSIRSRISQSSEIPFLPSGHVDVPEAKGMDEGMGVCDTGVQTDGQEESFEAGNAQSNEGNFASPRLLVPHSPVDNSLKQVTTSTPDFGEVKVELEILERRSIQKASRQSDDDERHFGELPVSSKFNADKGLKERLQNALARSLSHLMNLQALTVH